MMPSPTAIHEAGHAIVARAQGVQVVAIDPRSDASSSGSVRTRQRRNADPAELGRIALAGVVAERFAFPARAVDRAAFDADLRNAWTAAERLAAADRGGRACEAAALMHHPP